jgi:GMP synthase (glutamine-hydrolysing)
MSADFYEIDLTYMAAIIQKVQEIAGVGSVLYDVTTKPPGTIEWE